jgi:hypothetical protein
MWLSLLLPLQSFAAVTCGQHDHCAHGSPATHQHGEHSCGKCCCGAALAVTTSHGVAALPAAPEIAGAVMVRPPVIALDRLDRPPRFIPA